LAAMNRSLIGETLARVHRSLQGSSVAEAARFHWVRPEAEHLGIRPWVRPAVAALDTRSESLTWGLLHTLEGPLLYDLAPAVLYVGGPEHAESLVEAYLRHAVVPAVEVERSLLVMLRFRWAVQADYFAGRIVSDDLTGISGPADNENGLEDARRWLGRLPHVG
jgi:hypothetical protein